MNTGIGFSEMLVVLTLILVFFGSKELPMFIKKAAQFMAKVRKYSDKLRSELDSISRTIDEPVEKLTSANDKKQQMRNHFISLRKSIAPEEQHKKSEEIFQHLKATDEFNKAKAVMVYVSVGSEVSTRSMIKEMLECGKRVVVPYCVDSRSELGLAEIRNIDNDLITGEFGIPEPRLELRDSFFRSDLQLIICPGVAFDLYGARLGRGRAYYDIFLRDIKDRIPITGLAFDCQISKEQLPFDYHDISMDQVITESGLLLNKAVIPAEQKSPGIPAG